MQDVFTYQTHRMTPATVISVMCQWYLREKTNVVSKRAYLGCFGDLV